MVGKRSTTASLSRGCRGNYASLNAFDWTIVLGSREKIARLVKRGWPPNNASSILKRSSCLPSNTGVTPTKSVSHDPMGCEPLIPQVMLQSIIWTHSRYMQCDNVKNSRWQSCRVDGGSGGYMDLHQTCAARFFWGIGNPLLILVLL